MDSISDEVAIKRVKWLFTQLSMRYQHAFTRLCKSEQAKKDFTAGWLIVIKTMPPHCIKYALAYLDSQYNAEYVDFAPSPFAFRTLALKYVKMHLPSSSQALRMLINKDYKIQFIADFAQIVNISEIGAIKNSDNHYIFTDIYNTYIRSRYIDDQIETLIKRVPRLSLTIKSRKSSSDKKDDDNTISSETYERSMQRIKDIFKRAGVKYND